MTNWTLHPHAALRSAGFPFQHWEALLPRSLRERLATVETACAEAEEVRTALLKGIFAVALQHLTDPDERRRVSRLRKDVGRRRPVDVTGVGHQPLQAALRGWNERFTMMSAAVDDLVAGWDAAVLEVRRRLHRLAADSALHEAATLLSPSFRAALVRYAADPLMTAPNAKIRSLEQRLVLYLQRLVAKNETNSFFGPVGEAVLDPSADEPVQVDGEPGAGSPAVFSSPRVAEAIAAAMAEDPALRDHLLPRRSPAYRSAELGLRHAVSGTLLPLSAPDIELWQRLDGRTPVRELDASGIGRLLDAGAAVLTPLVDPWSSEPLDSLDAALSPVRDLPALQPWREGIDGFRQQLQRFATSAGPERATALADLEHRFSAVTGHAGRQGAGQMYTDRSVVFEERQNRLSLRLGSGLAAGLAEELDPALTYWAAAACQRLAGQHRIAAELFDRLWPGRDEVPLLTYLQAAARNSGPTEERTPAECAVSRLVAERTGEVLLSPTQLTALADEITQPVFTSIDLMIAAADPAAINAGRLRLVLGEAHAGHLLSVFPTDHFLRIHDPERARRRDEWLVDLLQTERRRLGWLITKRTTKIFQYPLPAIAIQLRPYLPAHLATPPSRLVVRREAGGVALHDQHGPLVLIPPVRRQAGFDPFAPLCLPAVENVPCGHGDVRPRVVVGRTVVQRAEWRCPPPAQLCRLHDVQRMLAARSWRRDLDLPEIVFVRMPWEQKPILVDLRNPVSVDSFAGMLRRGPVQGSAVLAISEMLPGPDELWLGDRTRSFTSELRILAARRAGHNAPAGATRICVATQ